MDWQLDPLFLTAEPGLGLLLGLWRRLNGLLNWAGLKIKGQRWKTYTCFYDTANIYNESGVNLVCKLSVLVMYDES